MEEEKRFKVDYDYQCGDWGMGRCYTYEQWAIQAILWCWMDDDYDLMAMIYDEYYNSPESMLDEISEIWQIHFVTAEDSEVTDLDKEDFCKNGNIDDWFNDIYKDNKEEE